LQNKGQSLIRTCSGAGEGGAEGAIDPSDKIQGGQKYNFAPPTIPH